VPPHAALDDVVHAQRAADHVDRLPAALELHGGGARDHAQPLGAGAAEDGDHLFRHPVREPLLLGIGPDGLEGQDGQHQARRRRQRVLHRRLDLPRRRVPAHGVLFQAAPHHALQGGRDVGQRRRLVLLDGGQRFRHGVCRERAAPGQHLVQHAAEREEVGPRVGGVASRLLGRAVAGRAQQHARALPRPFRDPEVEQLDLAVRGQEHVLGLEVAMDDTLGVGRAQPARDRGRDADGLGRGRRALRQACAQRLSLQQLGDDEGHAAGTAHVVQREDVRMR
jgi:hypothetical protein